MHLSPSTETLFSKTQQLFKKIRRHTLDSNLGQKAKSQTKQQSHGKFQSNGIRPFFPSLHLIMLLDLLAIWDL